MSAYSASALRPTPSTHRSASVFSNPAMMRHCTRLLRQAGWMHVSARPFSRTVVPMARAAKEKQELTASADSSAEQKVRRRLQLRPGSREGHTHQVTLSHCGLPNAPCSRARASIS